MRLTWKIKRRFLRLSLNALIITFVLLAILLILRWSMLREREPITVGNSFLQQEDMFFVSRSSEHTPLHLAKATRRSAMPSPDGTSDYQECTMATCFDVSHCLQDFKVFVYPPDRGEKPSPMYKRFLNAIMEGPYFTSDPQAACLFVLNLDTLDRDSLSSEYVQRISDKIRKLPHWNNGHNHLIFNFFSGSYPDYSEKIDFPYGNAMLAKASISSRWYRNGFDISIPLLPKRHKEKGKEQGILVRTGNLYPIYRHYLLVFKGKRYLWGHGSETRNSLHHLHNGKDIIMLTTCKHGKYWNRFMDERCALDNSLYERYDFADLIMNSTFCLVPRGRRLGSFRFLESLQASCIPVSLSNGFVLPFQEVIDWSKAILMFDERQLFQLPHLLRNLPADSILSLRAHSQFLWEEYFSSVEKVVRTSLEIIRARIQRTHTHFIWNRPPGALSVISSYSTDLSDYPFYYRDAQVGMLNYTAVVIATKPAPKGNSPLVLLLKSLCNATHLSKVVIVWIGQTVPKVMLPTHCSTPVIISDRREHKKSLTHVINPLDEVQTDAVLFLWEDTELISDEAEFGYATWLSNPDRLVGYFSQRHIWDPHDHLWKISSRPNNKYSMISIGAAFFHRYYLTLLTTSSSSNILKITDTSLVCLDVAMNFLISDVTGKPPLKLTHRTGLQRNSNDEIHDKQLKEKSKGDAYSSCVNMLSDMYGHIPLRYSVSRADPVLFGDDVSIFRKEFRKLENQK